MTQGRRSERYTLRISSYRACRCAASRALVVWSIGSVRLLSMRASAIERRFQALFLVRQGYSQRPFEERCGEDDVAVGLAPPASDQRSPFPNLGIGPRPIYLRNAFETVFPFLGLGGKQG